MRIVVSTNPDRERWLNDLIDSIPVQYADKLDVISTRHFEVDAIKQAYQNQLPSDDKRFLFLQDSCVIKDYAGLMLHVQSYTTALLIPRPSCYLAVYHVDALAQMWWPVISPDDKEESIRHETTWMDSYEEVARRTFNIPQVPVVFPEITDARALAENNFIEVHCERRLNLENDFISKRKGTFR
mgnify:CR=1 FL=1